MAKSEAQVTEDCARQRYVIQLLLTDYVKMFLNWLRTSCLVSITTLSVSQNTAP